MLKLTHFPAASLLATLLAGCAVAADPSSTPAQAVDAERPITHDESVVGNPPIYCIAPVTPMTGDWSCGSTGVRTGEKTATTTAGYTNNCTGRATVEFTTPPCPVTSSQPEDYELNVTALGVSSLSATACAASYLDYTIWGESSASSAWSVIDGGRVYGVFSNGYCHLLSPTSYPLSSAWSHFEISADAYEPLYWYFRGGVPVQIGSTPVNVFFDASFVE